ncbi:MAG: hypothetical protein ABW204_00040 [Microbacteriaceae bacterium]
MRHGRGARLARAAVAASIATLTALVSHVIAGGAVPQLIGVAVPLVLSLLVCLVLVGRRLSLIGLSLSVAGSQLLFHLLFVLGAGSTTVSSSGDAAHAIPAGHAGHAGHAHHLEIAGSADIVAAGTLMWAGHAVAAIVTIAALYLGESALTAVGRLLRLVRVWMLRAVILPVVGSARPAAAPLADDVLTLFSQVLGASPRHRGPPVLLRTTSS